MPMLSPFTIAENADVSYLDKLLKNNKGEVIPCPYSELKNVPQMHIQLWCHQNAVYQVPTEELIAWLFNEIEFPKCLDTIEIGSGEGFIARALGITGTDNYMQVRKPEVILHYELSKQPRIKYGSNVEELSAHQAVEKYKPETVIACWVTQKYKDGDTKRKIGSNMYGVEEEKIIQKVKKYILIGNHTVHHDKRILKLPHKMYRFPWLVSRSSSPDKNSIYVWQKNM